MSPAALNITARGGRATPAVDSASAEVPSAVAEASLSAAADAFCQAQMEAAGAPDEHVMVFRLHLERVAAWFSFKGTTPNPFRANVPSFREPASFMWNGL